jgi:hypothetical protein
VAHKHRVRVRRQGRHHRVHHRMHRGRGARACAASPPHSPQPCAKRGNLGFAMAYHFLIKSFMNQRLPFPL